MATAENTQAQDTTPATGNFTGSATLVMGLP